MPSPTSETATSRPARRSRGPDGRSLGVAAPPLGGGRAGRSRRSRSHPRLGERAARGVVVEMAGMARARPRRAPARRGHPALRRRPLGWSGAGSALPARRADRGRPASRRRLRRGSLTRPFGGAPHLWHGGVGRRDLPLGPDLPPAGALARRSHALGDRRMGRVVAAPAVAAGRECRVADSRLACRRVDRRGRGPARAWSAGDLRDVAGPGVPGRRALQRTVRGAAPSTRLDRCARIHSGRPRAGGVGKLRRGGRTTHCRPDSPSGGGSPRSGCRWE